MLTGNAYQRSVKCSLDGGGGEDEVILSHSTS